MKLNRKIALQIFEGVMFAFAGLSMVYALPDFLEVVNSTTPNFTRTTPLFLSTILLILLFFVAHALLHNASKLTRKITLYLGGSLLLLIGAGLTIYLMVLAFNGTFASLWESRFNWLYPVDSLLVGLLSDFLGGMLILHAIKHPEEEVTLRAPKALWKRIVGDYLFGPFYLLICMFFLGDVLLIPWTIDRSFANFGVTLPFYLLMILPIVEIGLYEYHFRDVQDEQKKFSGMLKTVPGLLLGGLVCTLWGYFGAINNPHALTESLTACFPLDYMASAAYGPMLLYAINLIAPLAYLIDFLFLKKKEAMEKEASSGSIEQK